MESSSVFKHYQTYQCWRGEKQTMLKSTLGRQLPYIVNFKRSTVQVFDIEWERVTHAFTFPEGCRLIDVDYFPTEENKLGILVGLEDEQKRWGAAHFVVTLAAESEGPAMRITHAAGVPAMITIVKTLFSSVDMANGTQETLGLYPKLLSWKHVVAIGCKETKCFLAQLPTSGPFNLSSESFFISTPKKNFLNLMAAFIKDENLLYTQDDGCYREYPTSAVSVSALALMPRSRTLLVGLSMGGILAAALNPSNQMVFLELHHEWLIRKLAPLEPEDDPDKFEYFICAVDRSSRHPVAIQLWRGSFKVGESMEVEEAAKYDRPQYHVCLEHKIPYGERWLAVNPIVTERGGLEGTHRRRNDSSMDLTLNSSQSFGCASNRSQVLLAYERRPLSISPAADPNLVVEAAIFDIDAWYYKRVPHRVSTDGTVLRQCAFMSCIKSNIESKNVNDIGILTLDSTDVTRFRSMVSDADQLFYPSSLSYDRVFISENTHVSWMKIQNIQDMILDKCASKLPRVIRNPDAMSSDLLAAGLVRKSVLTGSPNSSAAEINESELSTDQKIVLNAMVYYGKVEEFCDLATRNDLSDKIKSEIARWAVHEAVDFKRIISDRTVSLFQGNSTALSPLAEDTVLQGIKLFRIVHEYLKTCCRSVKDDGRLQKLAHSLKCMRNHTKLVSRFIIFHIVPVNMQVEQKMREMHEKRKNIAIRNKTALPIQVVSRSMHRLAPDGQFWNDMPHDEWYPPTPLDLLEATLNMNISERLKRELIVQYVLDWLRADPEHSEDTDKRLAVETIKVMTNQMLDVDLEKIYFILDQEKAALSKKTIQPDTLGVAKKVFSMQNEGLTYEKLWSGEVHLTSTIGKEDMERFEERMKWQLEGREKKKQTVLDPEAEMLYQVFLFEKQRYDLMSKEAIEANKLLTAFYPGMLKKGRKEEVRKTARLIEIENSVKAMYEKQKQKDNIPDVFATIGDKSGKKRRSEAFEKDGSSSPVIFVPPTAKRIQQGPKVPLPAAQDCSSASINESPSEREKNDEINMLIATPARYYKRPPTAQAINPDMLSPTNRQVPPVPTQNSILKTAKSCQSPSRGRIRFHASVRRNANESMDSNEEMQDQEIEEVPRPKGLNFAILEDEEETTPTRRSVPRETVQEAEMMKESGKEEYVETEKSYEVQEEGFQVLEDDPIETAHSQPGNHEEDTFEIRTDDILPGTDETYDLSEYEEMSGKTGENDKNEEKKLEEEVEKRKEVEKSQDVQDEINKKRNEGVAEVLDEFVDVEEQKAPAAVEQEEDEYQDVWDGIHRSFELQKDEDCEPVIQQQQENEGIEGELDEAHQELSVDVPLERTFEIQQDEGPQPLGDLPEAFPRASTVAGVEESKILNAPPLEDLRPPSANTRSKLRADSRPVTPVEEPVPMEKPKSKSRAASSIEKTSEVQEDEEEEERPLSRRTRAASAKKDPAPPLTKAVQEKPKTPRKTRAASVQKETTLEEPENLNTTRRSTRSASVGRATTKSRASSVNPKQEDAASVTLPARASRSRNNSRCVTPSRATGDEEIKKVVRKSPARKKITKEEEERPVTPENETINIPDASGSALMKIVNAKRAASSRAASAVSEESTLSASVSAKKTVKSSVPSTPRRGRSKSETMDKTPVTARSTSKRRTPAPEDEEEQLEEPPKKAARGRPRATPLNAIPEEPASSSSKTPKRAGSRSRANSSSEMQKTPTKGRKPLLEEVVEEAEDPEPTPLRRSTRRPQHP